MTSSPAGSRNTVLAGRAARDLLEGPQARRRLNSNVINRPTSGHSFAKWKRPKADGDGRQQWVATLGLVFRGPWPAGTA